LTIDRIMVSSEGPSSLPASGWRSWQLKLIRFRNDTLIVPDDPVKRFAVAEMGKNRGA